MAALKHGSLAGQDLSLLTERSVLWHETGVAAGFRRVRYSGHIVVDWAASLAPYDAPATFSYIGERQPDGYIAAPEGGWESNPVPGRRACIRDRLGFEYDLDTDSVSSWEIIIAFRLAGEAVSIPEGEGGALADARTQSATEGAGVVFPDPDMCSFELDILRTMNGEDIPGLVAGAAMWTAAAWLKGRGYAEGHYQISPKGVAYLVARSAAEKSTAASSVGTKSQSDGVKP